MEWKRHVHPYTCIHMNKDVHNHDWNRNVRSQRNACD